MSHGNVAFSVLRVVFSACRRNWRRLASALARYSPGGGSWGSQWSQTVAERVQAYALDQDDLLHDLVLILSFLTVALIIFYGRGPIWILYVVGGVLLMFSDYRRLLLLALFTIVLVILRGEESNFLIHIGDQSSYLLDGLAFYSGTFDADYHFPPMASAASWIGIATAGLDFTSVGFQVATSCAALIAFSICYQATAIRSASWLCLLIFLSSPILIWYSKSTYSENIFLFLFAASLWLAGRISHDRGNWKLLIALFLVSVLAPQTRGTGFVLGGLLGFFAAFSRSFGNRLTPYLLISVGAAGSFGILLALRYTYVWGWQLSSLLPGVPLWASAGGIIVGVGSMPFWGMLAARRLRLRITFARAVSGVFAAYIIYELASVTLNESGYVVPSAFNFYVDHFGYWLMPLLVVGAIDLVRRAANGETFGLYLASSYVLFSSLIVIRGMLPETYHANWLYWHRYYYSEAWFAHLIITAMGFACLLRATRLHYHAVGRRLMIVVVFGVFAGTVWSRMEAAISHAQYADSERQLQEFTIARDVVYLLGSEKIYYYDANHLVGEYLRASGARTVRLEHFRNQVDANDPANFSKDTVYWCVAKSVSKCRLSSFRMVEPPKKLRFETIKHTGGYPSWTAQEVGVTAVRLVPD